MHARLTVRLGTYRHQEVQCQGGVHRRSKTLPWWAIRVLRWRWTLDKSVEEAVAKCGFWCGSSPVGPG